MESTPLPSYTLGPARSAWLGDVELRLNDDLRNAVTFLGYTTQGEDGEAIFDPGGTGFFIAYKGITYLVTARHVAEALDPPFSMRASDNKGNPILLEEIIAANWFFPSDRSVDLAVVVGAPKNAMVLHEETILTPDLAKKRDFGVGDEASIVGLYRLLREKKKNLPIVHSGHVAMMPSDELIPQFDRRTRVVRHVEAYLIEAQTLEGLSGSPVFARHIWKFKENVKEKQSSFLLGNSYLIGVWSGAWDAPPGEVLKLERPEAQRVPVGMGLAVPIYKLIELLEEPRVAEQRKRLLEEAGAANQDSGINRPTESDHSAEDENPRHKEDFNRLLNEAVTNPPEDD